MSAAAPHPQNDGERLVRLETEMCEVREDVQEIGRDVKTLQQTAATKADVAAIKTAIENMSKSNDRRYASKLTERIVYGLVAVVSLSVLYALLQLIKL